jgi:hypothetical protein
MNQMTSYEKKVLFGGLIATAVLLGLGIAIGSHLL